MKPSQARIARGVSLMAMGGLVATALLAASLAASLSPEPAYNASAEVRMSAVITGVRQVPAGSPMAGVHLTVQTKTGVTDVYLGPADFIKIFKTNFIVGAPVQVIGSRVAGAPSEVILAREITEGQTSLTLREFSGAPVWEHWGVSADSAVSGG